MGRAAMNAAIAAGATNKYKGLYLIAQRRVENGFNLNPPGNNPMNIKDSGDLGTITLQTHEYYDNKRMSVISKFARFSSVGRGFEGYLKLLKKNFPDAYGALQDNSKTIIDFTSGLQNGGMGLYATDPSYEHKVQSMFKSVVSDYKEEINTEINTNNEIIQTMIMDPNNSYINSFISLYKPWIESRILNIQKLTTELDQELKLLNELK
jgi:flagellum-specific peptidoglycan hydrolase FlgJ